MQVVVPFLDEFGVSAVEMTELSCNSLAQNVSHLLPSA